MDILLITLISLSVLFLVYITIIILVTFYFARIPRTKFDAVPEFGILTDHRLKVKNKEIELWFVKQESITDNTVVLTHAWGKDRGRMVARAEKWFNLGFNTIIISARDHGDSDRLLSGMHLMRFKEDIDAVINWYGKPVVLHGHSAGGGASILAGSTNPLVRAVFAEAPPRVITSGLNEFYKPFSKKLTRIVYPGAKFIFNLLFIKYKDYEVNPILAAKRSNTPMTLLYALDDVVFNDMDRMIKEWGELANVRLEVFEKGGHSTICRQESFIEVLTNFVKQINIYQQ